MSLNQLTENSIKKWLIAKTYDLQVDGDIKITNPASRFGDTLQCTAPGVAQFVPLTVVPNLPVNFYLMDSGGNQVISSFFNFTAAPGFANPDFTLSTSNTLTCNANGVYLVIKKITRNVPANGGYSSETYVNGTGINYSTLSCQQTTGGQQGTGLTNAYLLNLAIGQTINEIVSINGASYQNDQSRQSTNIMFLKIA